MRSRRVCSEVAYLRMGSEVDDPSVDEIVHRRVEEPHLRCARFRLAGLVHLALPDRGLFVDALAC